MFRSFKSAISKLCSLKPFSLCDRRYLREPFQPLRRCPRWVCVEDAVRIINSEHLVYIQGGAATPLELVRAMTEHGICNNVRGVRLLHMALEGDAHFANPEFEKHFRSISLYIGANLREAVNEGRADFIPIFNHETPKLFSERGIIPDIALIHVSTPDVRGFCSLGTSVDCTRAAICHAKTIIVLFEYTVQTYVIGYMERCGVAICLLKGQGHSRTLKKSIFSAKTVHYHHKTQVNEYMPRTFGDSVIHSSHFDYAVKFDCPLPCVSESPLNEIEAEIGKIIAQRLVEDGATLQIGVGNIPDAVLGSLSNHKDLGIHSEMLSDGMVDLVEKGSITNRRKTGHRGRLVCSLGVGSKKLYDFIHNNPTIEMLGINYVNDPRVIASQSKMTAINPAIEIDITGQVCADSLGCKMYSGVGGQLDFGRGSAICRDGKGKSIVALPSVTSRGESRIQAILTPGGGVTTTRSHVHYVVTEYGVAQLFGKTLRQRACALIEIAHPDHRDCLERVAFDRLKCAPTKYL